jgi:hypothetical protein
MRQHLFPPVLYSLLLILTFQVSGSILQAQNAINVAPDPFGGQEEKKASPQSETPPGEAAPLSEQISQHITKLAEAERDKRIEFMKVVIDDIARLCDLDEPQREQLELAAKGASERSMKEWHEAAERYFRTRLDAAEGDAAKETLDLWKDSLKDVLTPEQVSRYENILAQRRLDRIEAFARMSLSTIDGHLRLTPDQRIKMAEIVHASAATYLDDVQSYWGDYFERSMLMSLANASEEETLRSILNEQQFDRLREATANFDHFWDQKRRLRRAKEKAAARKQTGEKEEEYKEKEAGAPEKEEPVKSEES